MRVIRSQLVDHLRYVLGVQGLVAKRGVAKSSSLARSHLLQMPTVSALQQGRSSLTGLPVARALLLGMRRPMFAQVNLDDGRVERPVRKSYQHQQVPQLLHGALQPEANPANRSAHRREGLYSMNCTAQGARWGRPVIGRFYRSHAPSPAPASMVTFWAPSGTLTRVHRRKESPRGREPTIYDLGKGDVTGNNDDGDASR